VTSLVLRVQSVSAVFCPAVFLQLASVERHCELNEISEQVQQANVFKHQTLMFHFSMHRPNSCKQLSHHTPVSPHEGIHRWFVASVVETTSRPGSSSSTALSRPWANFLHQTYIAGLVKYLSPYTGCTSDWMTFALGPFAHSKRITEGCSLCDDFNGNVAISNVYKWRHNDVIVIKLMACTQN